jgi:hypothetical protein
MGSIWAKAGACTDEKTKLTNTHETMIVRMRLIIFKVIKVSMPSGRLNGKFFYCGHGNDTIDCYPPKNGQEIKTPPVFNLAGFLLFLSGGLTPQTAPLLLIFGILCLCPSRIKNY